MDDFDIEMGDAADVPMEEAEIADIIVGDDQQEDGEVEETFNDQPTNDESQQVIPNKIHIRGLDVIDENQLKSYVSSHVGGKGADRVEWVDDTSANLVFGSDSAAEEALKLLVTVEIVDATQLPPLEVLPAKPFPERPDVALQVRFAVESDKKARNAAQRSRFYLLHPEWDPETEEGRRRREGRDRRYRDRGDRGGYRRNERNGRGRYDERFEEEEPDQFDVNLYDDDAGALARRVTPRGGGRRGRNSRSRSPSDRSEPDRHRSANTGKELFPDRRPRDPLRSERGVHSRGRSRSPARDDRDAVLDDLAKDREVVRNRETARSLKERITKPSNRTKELFPGKTKELFPGKTKELFPSKVAGGGKAQMDQVPEEMLAGMLRLSYDGAAELPPSFPMFSSQQSTISNKVITVKLADRITDPSNGISIKGLARQTKSQQQGLSIKGNSVKELFPSRVGSNSNAGKELFADKLEGRGPRRRQRAEDLFH
ncbi:hypothetical protein VSDG_09919 [Cytospora chrysosperma]|uniref:Uncharacterized protein n=1 Tax=Cytospora chrysosperma TaxID=252740 RepID=A0A423V9J4_CYTCH|nr:hypothetical protein VSDG_09919 [Valsa sordida]